MPHADEDLIRELEHAFNAAWDRHDPEGMAELLTDDAQFITVNGAWTTTRNGFRDLMAQLHGAGRPVPHLDAPDARNVRELFSPRTLPSCIRVSGSLAKCCTTT